MRMNKGVEWAVHACSLLAPLAKGSGLSLAALADYHGVPPAYMAKQMQLLSKAGIVHTSRGQSGGYSLAREPSLISLWDIARAVDGAVPAFRCTEIRQNGPCALARKDCLEPCAIATVFARAEAAWRDILRTTRLSDILMDVTGHAGAQHLGDIMAWYTANVTKLPDGNSNPKGR